MAIKAAEYYGRCQACDRLQKLPNGVLAKHGYQVAQYGYFCGVCRGAAHMPYELDCTYIRDTIIPEAVQEELRLVEYIAEVRKPVSEAKGYHMVYTPIGQIWQRLAILGEPEHKYPVIVTGKTQYNVTGITPVSRYSWLPNTNNLLEIAQGMNEYYAVELEKTDLRRIRRYIKWQEGRVADWKERPLPPVDIAKELRKKLDKEFSEREKAFIEPDYEAA